MKGCYERLRALKALRVAAGGRLRQDGSVLRGFTLSLPPVQVQKIRGCEIKGVQNCTAPRIGRDANCIPGVAYMALLARRVLVVQDDI